MKRSILNIFIQIIFHLVCWFVFLKCGRIVALLGLFQGCKANNGSNNVSLKYDTAFKGTVVNRILPSLHGKSLKITLTVPLI